MNAFHPSKGPSSPTHSPHHVLGALRPEDGIVDADLLLGHVLRVQHRLGASSPASAIPAHNIARATLQHLCDHLRPVSTLSVQNLSTGTWAGQTQQGVTGIA